MVVVLAGFDTGRVVAGVVPVVPVVPGSALVLPGIGVVTAGLVGEAPVVVVPPGAVVMVPCGVPLAGPGVAGIVDGCEDEDSGGIVTIRDEETVGPGDSVSGVPVLVTPVPVVPGFHIRPSLA